MNVYSSRSHSIFRMVGLCCSLILSSRINFFLDSQIILFFVRFALDIHIASLLPAVVWDF